MAEQPNEPPATPFYSPTAFGADSPGFATPSDDAAISSTAGSSCKPKTLELHYQSSPPTQQTSRTRPRGNSPQYQHQRQSPPQQRQRQQSPPPLQQQPQQQSPSPQPQPQLQSQHTEETATVPIHSLEPRSRSRARIRRRSSMGMGRADLSPTRAKEETAPSSQPRVTSLAEERDEVQLSDDRCAAGLMDEEEPPMRATMELPRTPPEVRQVARQEEPNDAAVPSSTPRVPPSPYGGGGGGISPVQSPLVVMAHGHPATRTTANTMAATTVVNSTISTGQGQGARSPLSPVHISTENTRAVNLNTTRAHEASGGPKPAAGDGTTNRRGGSNNVRFAEQQADLAKRVIRDAVNKVHLAIRCLLAPPPPTPPTPPSSTRLTSPRCSQRTVSTLRRQRIAEERQRKKAQRENPHNEKAIKRKRQRQKLDRAKDYLEVMAFSHSNQVRSVGLTRRLKGKGTKQKQSKGATNGLSSRRGYVTYGTIVRGRRIYETLPTPP